MSSRTAIENRKRPVEDTPRSSPVHPAKLAMEEESYSNPVKKKARVSLYHKTSPNMPRPRSVSPLDSTVPMLVDPSMSALLTSSSLADLKDADMNKLGLSPNQTSRKRSPKRPLSANSRAIKTSPGGGNKRISPLTTSLPPLNDSFSTSSFDTVNSENVVSDPKSSALLSATVSSKSHRKEKQSRHQGGSTHKEADVEAVVPDVNASALLSGEVCKVVVRKQMRLTPAHFKSANARLCIIIVSRS